MDRKLDIQPIDAPIGAVVKGLQFDEPLDPDALQKLFDALDRHVVLVIREAEFPRDAHVVVEFCRQLGVLRRRAPDPAVLRDLPEVTIVSNTDDDGVVGIAGASELDWHADMAFTFPVTRYVLLDAVEVPSRGSGGETEFTDLRAAYNTLPRHFKERVDYLQVEYTMRADVAEGTYYSQQTSEMPRISHPLVQKNSRTGARSLWPNGGFIDSRIVGMPQQESRDLLASLRLHATAPEFVYTHSWLEGDAVLWDNMATLHCRQGFDPHERRVVRRVYIEDRSPVQEPS
ncbi:MAG: TauD/TfdA family dioxygenase [Acidimicrobiales bacterium]